MNDFTVYAHIMPNNKRYIGITKKKVTARWGKDGSGYKTQILFYRAIQKYGWDNIQHEIIAEHLTKEEACKLETELIERYKCNNPDYGYNVSNGGELVQLGLKRSAEQIQHISDGHKGKPLTEVQLESLRKNHEKFKDVPRSAEVKQKISLANSGKVRTPEMRKNISEAQKKRTNYRYGYHLSEETKEKLRQANLGRKASDETRKKISENNAKYWRGKSRSQETKDKISASLVGRVPANKGKSMSEDSKKKLSESQKNRLKDVDLSGKNNGFYGKHHTPETIEKIRQAAIRNAQLRKEKKSENVD